MDTLTKEGSLCRGEEISYGSDDPTPFDRSARGGKKKEGKKNSIKKTQVLQLDSVAASLGEY